jgi:hypothetical protein
MGRSNRTVRAGPPVNDLVTRAGKGDKQAWDALVERYAPLIWSICRRHRLSSADADDTGQRVWLQLVSELDTVRDPAALPAGWPSRATGNAATSGGPRADCRPLAVCWTPGTFPASRPG